MNDRVGFGPRLGAYLIDLVILVALAAALAGTFGPLFGGAVDRAVADARQSVSAAPAEQAAVAAKIALFTTRLTLTMSLLSIVYYFMESVAGLTIGKLLLGLRVSAVQRGAPAGGPLFKRYVAKTIPNVLAVVAALTLLKPLEWAGSALGLAFVGGCFMVLAASRQALHDRIAGTAVFRRADLQSGAVAPAA